MIYVKKFIIFFKLEIEILFAVIQSYCWIRYIQCDTIRFSGDGFFKSFNNASRDEDNIVDQEFIKQIYFCYDDLDFS